MTADNEIHAFYYDSNPVSLPVKEAYDWTKVVRVDVPNNFRVLAVKARCNGGLAGFKGNTWTTTFFYIHTKFLSSA